MRIPAELLLPEGMFAAGVSGGADSVALLLLAFGRIGHVVHVHHELRGDEADVDARFVRDLCARLGVRCTIVRRQDVPEHRHARTPAELRALRLAAFREVVQGHGLSGVLLGHHADDVAETVLLRLMRGSGPEGLCGIGADVRVAGGGVRLVRPLLGVRREELREFLRSRGQTWREDSSNLSLRTPRNWVRSLLAASPGLTESVLSLAGSCRAYVSVLRRAAKPVADKDVWRIGEVAGLPKPVARTAVRVWLGRQMGHRELLPGVIDRVLAWTSDAAAPRQIALPGGWYAVRSRGQLRLRAPGSA